MALDLFGEVAAETGVDPRLLSTFSKIESGGNPNTQTGSYKGLFQLSDGEFRKHANPGDNIFDPVANTRAAARKLKYESDVLASKLGRPPTPHEVYMAHQQGLGGAQAHWSNPDAPAWQNMLSTAEGRQKGAGWAKQAIWGNVPDDVKAKYGSVDNMTSAQFTQLWKDKYDRIGGGSSSEPSASPNVRIAQAMTGQPTMSDADYIGATPEELAFKRQLAMKLIAANTGAPTAGTGWAGGLEALARVMNSHAGYTQAREAKGEERQSRQAEAASMQRLLDGLNGGQARPMAPPMAPPMQAPTPAPQAAPTPTSPAAPALASPNPGTPQAAPPLPAPMGPDGQRMPAPSELRPPVNPQAATARGQNRLSEEEYARLQMQMMANPAYLRLPPDKRKLVDMALAQKAPIPAKIIQAGDDVVDLSNPTQPKVLYRGGKPPAAVQEYEVYQQQQRAQGQPALSFHDWHLETKRASVAQPENSFDNAAAKSMAGRYEKIIEAGDTSRAMLGQMDILREHSRNIGNEGAMATIKQRIGPLATSLGIPIDKLDDIQAFQSIIEKVAPTMRAPGSGATSDIEYQGFLKSLPQATATAQGREMIINQLSALAKDATQRAEIASRVLNKEIPRKEADEVLRRLPDVMSIYKTYQTTQPQQPKVGERPHNKPVGATMTHPQHGLIFKDADGKWYPVPKEAR